MEICLDHNDTRWRGNINNETSPIASLHLQIIPSCGMQIMASGVTTGDGDIVFTVMANIVLMKKRQEVEI